MYLSIYLYRERQTNSEKNTVPNHNEEAPSGQKALRKHDRNLPLHSSCNISEALWWCAVTIPVHNRQLSIHLEQFRQCSCTRVSSLVTTNVQRTVQCRIYDTKAIEIKEKLIVTKQHHTQKY